MKGCSTALPTEKLLKQMDITSIGIPQLSQMNKIFIENQNQILVNKIMNELINPLKEKFDRNTVGVEQLLKECDIVFQKLEEYKSQFQGTEEMISEKMEFIYSEVELMKKECEQRKYHDLQIKLLEEESRKTDEERKKIEQNRLDYENRSRQITQEIEKLRLEIANREKGGVGLCIIQ